MMSSVVSNKAMFIGLGVGSTIIASAMSYLYYKYLKRDVMPEKWRRVGTVQQINIFPIKSCGPLVLPADEEIQCEVLGLRCRGILDRCLMLINNKNEMVTARIHPLLLLVRPRLVGDTKLIISADGMDDLVLDLATLANEAPGADVHTSVWGSKLDAMLCGKKYDKWFSQYVLKSDSGLQLVYYPYNKPVRSVNARLAKQPFITKNDTGTFNDATSYMLTNLASVDDLNTRLSKQSVKPLQFRGSFNIKMDEDKPYAEDKWQWVRIGENSVFRKVAPCTRCILPNIDPITGERDPAGNPLKTLKSYRLLDDSVSPTLGIHLGLRTSGTIKVNDPIYVEDV